MWGSHQVNNRPNNHMPSSEQAPATATMLLSIATVKDMRLNRSIVENISKWSLQVNCMCGYSFLSIESLWQLTALPYLVSDELDI